jgi:hypothetical protein
MKRYSFLLIPLFILSLLFISCQGIAPTPTPTPPSEGEGEEPSGEPTGRVVLMELFNVEGCPASRVLNPLVEEVVEEYSTDEVILVQLKGWLKGATDETMERFSWYVPENKHVPFIAFNGLSDTFSEGVSGGGGGGGGGGGTPSTPTPDPEEIIYVKDTNPDSDILYVAGEEDGDKLMVLGQKDADGNILKFTGAAFINELGEGLVIEVDDNCYPSRLVDSDGNKLTFSNYTASTVDVNIYDFDENLLEGPITVDINPDLLAELIQNCNSTLGSRALSRDAHTVAHFLKVGSVLIEAGVCGAAIGAAIGSGGFAIPVAVLACSSFVVDTVQLINPDALPWTEADSTFLGINANIAEVAFTFKISPWGIAGTITGIAGDLVEIGATKSDILEVNSKFLQAIVEQDWQMALFYCVNHSEAYNMVLGTEIAFAFECLDKDNTEVEISFNIEDLLIADRPTAHMYNTALITLNVDGYGSVDFSGESLYTTFEEVSQNRWELTKSGILELLEVPPGPLSVPTLYDPGTNVSNNTEYTLSWSSENQHTFANKYLVAEDTNSNISPNNPHYNEYIVEVPENSINLSHNVTQDTTYYYRVYSCTGCQGCDILSEPSNQVSITVLDEYVPENRVYNITQGIYYNTIQAALDDANSGDTIELSDGTYNELISFPEEKELTLQSVNGPEYTIIDGSGLNGTVVTITYNHNGITLQDLTITGGNSSDGTGGIRVFDSTLNLKNCSIFGNSGLHEGAIGNFINSVTSINDCIISNNYSDWKVTIWNATYSQLTISNSTISHNIGGGNQEYDWCIYKYNWMRYKK